MREVPKDIAQRLQFDQFVKHFIEGHEQSKPADIERFIQEIKILEKYSLDSKRYYCLFDHSKFYPAYISADVEKEGGYSIDYILNQGLFFIFKMIHWKQLLLPFKVAKWGNHFLKLLDPTTEPVIDIEVWCCGVKLRDRWNKWRTILIKQKMLTVTKDNKPLLSFLEIDEITSIFKADFSWYRAIHTTNDKRLSRVYFSSGSKKESIDLLSTREIEILRLVKENKSSQEIGTLLNISKNTVERHRKNMIARVGVKDMPALIRICKLIKIV